MINEGKGNCRRSDPWAREMEVLRRRPLRRLFSFSCFAFSWAFDRKRTNEDNTFFCLLTHLLFRRFLAELSIERPTIVRFAWLTTTNTADADAAPVVR